MEPIGGEDPAAQYELCCNIHIMRAMKLVAIIGLVVNPLWTVYMVFSSPITPYDFALVAICLYALILVAIQKENPRLLIPFLIFNEIFIALLIGGRALYCFVLLFTINSSWFWEHWRHDHPSADPTVEKVGLIIHFIVNLGKLLLNCCFEHIIYRGYLFMMSRAEATPLLGQPEAAPLLGPIYASAPIQNA